MQTLSFPHPSIDIVRRAASFSNSPSRSLSAGSDSSSGKLPAGPELERAVSETTLVLPVAALPAAPRPPSRFRVCDTPVMAPPPVETTYVFVYGSLLPGLHNHGLISDAELLGYHKTLPQFDMFSLGSYPAVCNQGQTAISGALYRVNRATLRKLDQLEGHPRWYTREPVKLEGVEQYAWMYLMPREDHSLQQGWAELVPSGDWFTYYTQKEPAKPLEHQPLSAPTPAPASGAMSWDELMAWSFAH